MHGTAPATRKAYDRSAITRAAWATRREATARQAWFDAVVAEELQHRAKFIDTAETEAERARRIASVTSSAKPLVRRPTAPTWGECMRAAWAAAKLVPAPMTEFAARRFFAEMSDDASVTARELRQIDREERAARAA